jgi:hypothetical protein
MNNYWGPPNDDDEPLPDWMDPIKCKQVNEAKENRKRTGKDLMSVINEALQKPAVPIIIETPKE